MARTFSKHLSPDSAGDLRLEAAGLAWLAEAEPQGGVHAAHVFESSQHHLTEERVAMVAPAAEAGHTFGRALAITHAQGAPWYGCPPTGWSGAIGAIGRAPMDFVTAAPADPAGDTWGRFYSRHRIVPYVRAALKLGSLPESAKDLFGRVCARLEAGDFDTPQPGLVHGVARLHGDLWSGNVLWAAPPWPEGTPGWTGAVVIDPAAHGGHAETDLAMLALFGIPQLHEILEGYESVSPLAEGWRERVGLHQLYPLLVHAVLFGPSYGERAMDRARAYV
ncbi:MAG: fructosamine kinase family protein [Bifidobacteriaceae bacterium]|nr:fructosamine kinase family protein [Bifidobacteriaceae bacterium]